jgi:DNA helicase II / ATP-dependent DNA helicase PcrA
MTRVFCWRIKEGNCAINKITITTMNTYFEKYHKYSSPRQSSKKPFTPSSWWFYCKDFPWNDEQLKVFDAICNTPGNYIVNSKAGGGKTTLLKALLMLFEKGSKISIVAFNKHIAETIDNSGVLDSKTQGVSTSHGLGFSMLMKHRYGRDIDVEPSKVRKIVTNEIELLLSANPVEINKSIYVKYLSQETLDHLGSFFDIVKKPVKGAKKPLNKKALIDWQVEIVGACKKTLTNPALENLDDLIDTYRLSLQLISIEANYLPLQKVLEKIILLAIPDVLEKSDQIYAKTGEVDYDDMIYLPNKLDLPASNKTALLVDECQDLNIAQITLIEKYHKLGTRIIAVGDPRQSIYGFQYAVPECWDELKNRFNLTEINMNYTYRCGKNIVKYIVDNGYHDSFVAYENNSIGNVESIEQTGLVWRLQPGDLVVSRMNAPLVRLCVSLYLHKKQAKVRGRKDLFLELINMLKPYCDTQEKWKNREGFDRWLSDANKRIQELMLDNQEASAEILVDKVECICILINDLGHKCSSFTVFEELVRDLFTDESEGGIILSSIHRAKGDEADTVYVLGYTSLPYRKRAVSEWEKQQEWNLVYVALSRAKNNLYLVDSPLFKLDKSEIESSLLT